MLYKKSYFYKADDFPEIVVNPRGELKSLAKSCQFNLSDDNFDPFKDVDMETLFSRTQTKDNQKKSRSQVFFDPDGHNDAFKAHPLTWDSIVYRPFDK